MVNIFLLINIIFISILSLTIQTNTKIKFLSLTKDFNYNNNQNNYSNLLQIPTNTLLETENTEENLFNLMSEYRNKLLKKTIFAEIIKNEKKINEKEAEKDLLRAIFIDKNKDEKLESYFNSTEFIWENLPALGEAPSARRGQSMVLADTYLIVFGGSDLNSKFYNDVYYFDFLKKSWMKASCVGNIPTPRADHSAVIYGTTMWVFGGASSSSYLNDLYSFNIENREWKKHEFMGRDPKNRSGHSAIIDDQAKIYIFGGYSESGHSNDIFVINILAERYENPLLSGRAPVPREKSAMSLLDKTLYIYGGHQNGIIYNDMHKLNLVNSLWEKVSIQGLNPIGYKGFSAERVGKELYITGGCDFENKFCNEETFIFETTNSSWSKLSTLQQNSEKAKTYLNSNKNNQIQPSKRSFTTLQFFRGALVAFGGCEMLKNCFNDLNILNLQAPCPSNCSGNGSCKGKLGCQCFNDFILHDCSLKIKCKEDCNQNGFCKSNAKCACFSGWSGDTCSSIVNCAKNCTSAANGLCLRDGTCRCNEGFFGKDCGENNNVDTNVNPLINLINGNNKQIKETNSELKAEFNTKIEIRNGICLNDCSGNGECNVVLKKCECKEPYFGEDCSQKTEKKLEVKEEKPIVIPKKPVIKRVIEAPPEKKWRIFYINSTLYQENDKCEGGCGSKGICLNSTCLCNQGLTGEKCSMTYKDILQRGYNPKKYIKHYAIFAGAAMMLTLLFTIFKK